jgi:hypothetical protein
VKPYLHEGSISSIHVARFDTSDHGCDGRLYAEGGVRFDGVALEIAAYTPFGSHALISHSQDWVWIRAGDGTNLASVSFRRATEIELEWRAVGATGAAGGRIRGRAGEFVTIENGEFEWVAVRPVSVPFMALDDVNVNTSPRVNGIAPLAVGEPRRSAAATVPDEFTTAALILAGLLFLLLFWRHARHRRP